VQEWASLVVAVVASAAFGFGVYQWWRRGRAERERAELEHQLRRPHISVWFDGGGTSGTDSVSIQVAVRNDGPDVAQNVLYGIRGQTRGAAAYNVRFVPALAVGGQLRGGATFARTDLQASGVEIGDDLSLAYDQVVYFASFEDRVNARWEVTVEGVHGPPRARRIE
jgi:hypothetical protein